MKTHQPLEIFDIQKKYPFRYKLRMGVPGWIALVLVLWILIWYMLFLIYEIQGAMFVIGTIILVYFLWWLIRWCEYIVATLSALFQLKKHEKISFENILFEKQQLTSEEKLFFQKLPTDKSVKQIIHWCMIPMYNEWPDILYETIKAIRDANYDLSHIAVTIQWEAAKEENFYATLKYVEPLTKDFWYFWHSLHVLQPDETAWKWANITYGAKELYPTILSHFNTTADNVLVTTLDADNIPDQNYFSVLSYTYLTTPNRKYASYQPVVFFFNNFWQAPFFSKIVWLFNTFWILFNFTKKFWPRNFSSHAQPLDALIDLWFWSKQTIVEDGHQYRRSFFGFKSNYECVPVYAKIFQDCNLDETLWKTIKAQYNQMRRRSHGAQDIPYIRSQMLDQRKSINKGRVIFEFGRSLEGIILRSTLHIVLLAWLVFSFFKDIPLSNYISLGATISIFTKIAFTLTITSLLLSIAIFPFDRLKHKSLREKIEILGWFAIWFFIFVWPSLVIFSWFPALHTQIGILFGKPMKKFNVTKKIR